MGAVDRDNVKIIDRHIYLEKFLAKNCKLSSSDLLFVRKVSFFLKKEKTCDLSQHHVNPIVPTC